MGVGAHGVVGLDHSGHLGHDIGCAPGRTSEVAIGDVAVDNAVDGYLKECLFRTSDDGRFGDVALCPVFHVAEAYGHLAPCAGSGE